MAETAEASKFLLLEAIMDLIDGKIPPEHLKETLQDSRKSLATIRKDFEANVSSLEPRIQEGTAGEIQMVRQLLDDFERAFTAVEKYFSTGQKFDLISGGEAVKRCSDALNFAIETYKNKALLVMGPTDIPTLNLLLDCYREVQEDPSNLARLRVIITREFLLADGAMKELEMERKAYKFDEQEMLINTYKELKESIEYIGHFIKSNKKDMLEKGIENIKRIYPKIKELIPLVNYKRMIQFPTSSPEANLLLNMSFAYRQGNASEELFAVTLKEADEEFKKIKMKVKALLNQETDSVIVKEELQKAMEGLELYQTALNDFFYFLETREGIVLEQAEREIKQAVQMLEGPYKLLQEMAEREGKVPCVRCGFYNSPDRKTCQKCGAILPISADKGIASTFEVQVGETTVNFEEEDVPLPGNLEIMFTAVNQVADGEISQEEFAEKIDWLQGIMETHQAAGFAPIPQINLDKLKGDQKIIAEKMLEAVKEASPLFEAGYQDFEEGLEYFREYLDVGDQNLLVKGVQIMWEGNKKLYQVEKLTKDFEELRKKAQ